jgi:hypothetical protein
MGARCAILGDWKLRRYCNQVAALKATAGQSNSLVQEFKRKRDAIGARRDVEFRKFEFHIILSAIDLKFFALSMIWKMLILNNLHNKFINYVVIGSGTSGTCTDEMLAAEK